MRRCAAVCNFKKTVVARVERDPAFARSLLDEAATLFLSGEPETARLILRDLVTDRSPLGDIVFAAPAAAELPAGTRYA
jgi:hypothetical protein